MNPSTRIFATCPETGEPLYTGIQLSVDLFDCLVGIDAPVFCPHCKAIHRWTRHSSFQGIGSPVERAGAESLPEG